MIPHKKNEGKNKTKRVECIHTTTIAMEIQTRIWMLHDFHIVNIFQVLTPVQPIVAWEAPDVHLTIAHRQALLCYLGHGLHNQFTTSDFDTVQISHTKQMARSGGTCSMRVKIKY
jgi:hypothetical protein